jgi:WD40 repeat protein
LASTGADNTVRLWDVATRKQVHLLKGHASWGSAVAFRGDGRVLASSAGDGTVRLWDAKRGTPGAVFRLASKTSCVEQVVFSPSGRYLITANGNGTCYVVRLSAGP